MQTATRRARGDGLAPATIATLTCMPCLPTGIAQMRESSRRRWGLSQEGLNWTCGCRHIRLAFNCSPRGRGARPATDVAPSARGAFGPFPGGRYKRVARTGATNAHNGQRSGRTLLRRRLAPCALILGKILIFRSLTFSPNRWDADQGPILWLLVREVVPTPAMINWLWRELSIQRTEIIGRRRRLGKLSRSAGLTLCLLYNAPSGPGRRRRRSP